MPSSRKKNNRRTGNNDTDTEGADSVTPPDFEQFVRSAFGHLNVKIDVMIAKQATFEASLSAMNDRVTENTNVLADVIKSVEHESGRIDEFDLTKSTLAALNDRNSKELDESRSEIAKLHKEIDSINRYSRSFNVRFVGIAETENEDCVEQIGSIIRERFGLEGKHVENAHRVGRKLDGRPRHIIVRFFCRTVRTEIRISARTKLAGTPYRVVDDLTQNDLAEKQRIQPYMKKLYEDNQRPSFRNGRLHAGGRPVPKEDVDAFLRNRDDETRKKVAH